MLTPIIHSESGLNLPFPPDLGATVLGVGVVVLFVIAYDIYRQQWLKEGGR